MWYLLNAIVPPDLVGGERVRLDMAHIGTLAGCAEELERLLRRHEYVAAVGHPATAALLGVPVDRRRVAARYGDAVIAVRLAGSQRPTGDQDVGPSGLEVWVYRVGEALPPGRGASLLRQLAKEE